MTAADVRILGTGIVSRCMALALAHQGLQVAVQARRPSAVAQQEGREDVRAYALNPSSVALLKALKVWDALPAKARTAVHDMHVRGDAPGAAIEFSAWSQVVPELAWIVDAAALESVLEAACSFSPNLQIGQAESGPSTAALTLIAEGKASAERERLGARFELQSYGHSAVAARLISDKPHGGVAHQWFRSPDVLALLPFDQPEIGYGWALVWSQAHEQAEHWQQTDAPEFEEALQEATGGACGALRLASPRVLWPLAIGHAQPVFGPGWALLGDAAHVVHPLAGQGLNLGLADVLALAQVISQRESWRSLGDADLLARYARRRQLPSQAMAGLTDGLWQLFADSHPLARELRNHGLNLVNRLPPIKRWLMQRAMKV